MRPVQVYPRVGGGNSSAPTPNLKRRGLSPRGRGKHGLVKFGGDILRSIPAWAGETRLCALHERRQWVYPRVGGGNHKINFWATEPGGLSPRGRGKPTGGATYRYTYRSIPAWAGETLAHMLKEPSDEVYPRVGGGNTYSATADNGLQGLSPRGRGKLLLNSAGQSPAWSIPAWAGETTPRRQTKPPPQVYPRVGGGNRIDMAAQRLRAGLSPRGRGKLEVGGWECGRQGSIPAWAGETTRQARYSRHFMVYPRVGGGNAGSKESAISNSGLSPRGRGKRRPCPL